MGKHHDFSAGLVIGGKDLRFEWSRLGSCNVLICTPGRLLQHMEENPQFDASSLRLLVLDEADRCLEMGFAPQMNAILQELPQGERQTLLFSATQTRSVRDLARVGMRQPGMHRWGGNNIDPASSHFFERTSVSVVRKW